MNASKRLVIISAGLACALAIVGMSVLGWYATRPGPMDFVARGGVASTPNMNSATGTPADFKDQDIISRGRYLTAAADCQACHTVQGGKPFAGGRPFATPFGTLYSPNITSDASTGIGHWSDSEFLAALHGGVGRGGKRLYPAFPYASYTYLSDADSLAIKAYLFSLTPAVSTAPENTLRFPFNQRWLMSFWSLLFNPDRRFEPVTTQSVEWNRGAYLVEGLGHCGECHTSRNKFQGLDNRLKFSGSLVDGWNAYNITADPQSGLGAWSDVQLEQYLATGHAQGRGTAGGPMAKVVELSLSHLTPSDIHAIATYLRSVPPIKSASSPAVRDTTAAAQPVLKVSVGDQRDLGQKIFGQACVGCHTWSGHNTLLIRAQLTGSRALNDPSGLNAAQMVMYGTASQNSDGTFVMPGFASTYSNEEIAAVVNYATERFGVAHSTLAPSQIQSMRLSR